MLPDASGSSPGAGAFPERDFAWWYLGAKPPGSKLVLNEQGGQRVQFVPDQPGTYRIHLVLVASVGADELLHGKAAAIDVEVASAVQE